MKINLGELSGVERKYEDYHFEMSEYYTQLYFVEYVMKILLQQQTKE